MFFEKTDNLFIGRFAELYRDPDLHHGISTRKGGVSTRPYSSLNLGLNTSDKMDRVQENRKRFFQSVALSTDMLSIPQQVHSDHVKCVIEPGIQADTDALITNIKGITLTVQVADCLPIYLYDPDKYCIGLVHAGWRGSVATIISKTVHQMQRSFKTNPENIQAFLGPSIGPCCYEVGPEVIAQFSTQHITNGYLDLWKCNSDQLIKSGVKPSNIIISRLCTVCQSDLFFSHRASGNITGRMIAYWGLSE